MNEGLQRAMMSMIVLVWQRAINVNRVITMEVRNALTEAHLMELFARATWEQAWMIFNDGPPRLNDGQPVAFPSDIVIYEALHANEARARRAITLWGRAAAEVLLQRYMIPHIEIAIAEMREHTFAPALLLDALQEALSSSEPLGQLTNIEQLLIEAEAAPIGPPAAPPPLPASTEADDSAELARRAVEDFF
jgi:hypothetical protein